MFDTMADRFAADVKPTGQHAEEDEVPSNIVYHYAGQQRHANTSRTSRASRVSGRSSGQHQMVSRTPDSSRGQQQDVFDNQIGSDQPTVQDLNTSNYNPNNASRDYSFDSPEVDVDEDAVCAAAAPGVVPEHVDVDVDL